VNSCANIPISAVTTFVNSGIIQGSARPTQEEYPPQEYGIDGYMQQGSHITFCDNFWNKAIFPEDAEPPKAGMEAFDFISGNALELVIHEIMHSISQFVIVGKFQHCYPHLVDSRD
jgi:hypothetical protein